jgi:Tfp pilus assembly protein PilF
MQQRTMSLGDALQLGAGQLNAGRLDQARSIFQQVLQADPINADALHLLGVIALRQGDSGRAARLMERAIEANPQEAPFFLNLGNARAAAGEIEPALASGVKRSAPRSTWARPPRSNRTTPSCRTIWEPP